ncbi:hypothetical protein F5Y05DRAFT_342885 [Hypoxylon sp. FL0543]|nr:hypothetical protein F5Y05DRAFT_342885 [Hypoxylon sp. FL0543]
MLLYLARWLACLSGSRLTLLETLVWFGRPPLASIDYQSWQNLASLALLARTPLFTYIPSTWISDAPLPIAANNYTTPYQCS